MLGFAGEPPSLKSFEVAYLVNYALTEESWPSLGNYTVSTTFLSSMKGSCEKMGESGLLRSAGVADSLLDNGNTVGLLKGG